MLHFVAPDLDIDGGFSAATSRRSRDAKLALHAGVYAAHGARLRRRARCRR